MDLSRQRQSSPQTQQVSDGKPNINKIVLRQFFVENNEVSCPKQGKVVVETCFYCPAVETVSLDTDSPAIFCRPQPLGEQTQFEQVAYQRLGFLRMAESLGNVSEACRRAGISRKQYYHFKRLYESQGLAGLFDAHQVQHEMWNQEILAISEVHPDWGCHSIARELARRSGIRLSAPTIQAVLNNLGRGTKNQRVASVRD